ncbi:hypothetical protein C1645_752315 [Glomus cerebriforme]|uniref:Zn(2)-C6 fungal-type domain-containing protein n=1 Tax=Glomus cerebriforme TaxID=658196 RepID=A0A397THG0_9GLOM|nr:hypothetical protein C1645_752315 [Glomus cerebriforme]
MTATKPTTTPARYNQIHQVNNNNLAKRTRGPINKRACQRCRQGKIRCDGDAESGKPCSNCDPQHCKYDNSPRKNKQVESLKLRLNVVEEQLITITSEVGEQLQTKDIEKEIICLLYESKEHFIGYESLFEGLKDALKQSKFVRPILPITFELLKRLGEGKCIPDIMKSLQRFVDCANSDSAAHTLSSAEILKKIEENYLAQTFPSNDNILPVDSMMIQPITIPGEVVDIGQLNLHSGDEDSSESHSIGFDDAYDASGEPHTPPGSGAHNQVHSETKCFDSNNAPQHMTATSTGPDFVGSNFYENHQYFPSYQYNMMEAMNTMNQMSFLPPTTTSPTDEQITWN